MKIGIIAAIPEEINTIHNAIDFHETTKHAEREYHLGNYGPIELVLVISRVGKVSASITATSLIEKFNVDKIIFTGMAGAVSNDLEIGDIVLGSHTYQHDLDARPFCELQFEVPLTGRDLFQLDSDHLNIATSATQNFMANLDQYIELSDLEKLNIKNPTLHTGIIATGDHFIENVSERTTLNIKGMAALAVEMEGAAVAQVCAEYQRPCILIRTISDKANHSALINLQAFAERVASYYSSGIVQEILKLLVNRERN